MAVVNRCALSVAPRRPMLDWSRPFWTREDMEGLGDEQSLYLLPTWDDEQELRQRLEERWPAIFAMFQAWFELRCFPLVEDLGAEALRSFELEPGFEASVREALG
jgi:hypothetical protein